MKDIMTAIDFTNDKPVELDACLYALGEKIAIAKTHNVDKALISEMYKAYKGHRCVEGVHPRHGAVREVPERDAAEMARHARKRPIERFSESGWENTRPLFLCALERLFCVSDKNLTKVTET